MMKKIMFICSFLAGLIMGTANAQDLKEKDVPENVKLALSKKFPEAKKVSWEKEKGNFEANWGGKSGEDFSAIFTPSGNFQELTEAISIDKLPPAIVPYVTKNYNGAKIKEAGKVTDNVGKKWFEVELKGKALLFDEKGLFIKED